MDGNERREKIIKILSGSNSPVAGGDLAKLLQVSRQVIVQDIALLRAVNKNILSTTKGYILYYQERDKVNRCFRVKHTTEQIEDELNTIVDMGGKILNVIVSHEIYGEITVDLIISSRQDVKDFVEKVRARKAVPLKILNDDIHFHMVEADSEEILDRVERALIEKNYLI